MIHMTNSVTFLHAADLHLDSPCKGFSDVPEQVFKTMRESTFRAFDNLIQTAIDKQVDFILLVGDLFDEKKQSLKAQLHLREGFIRLQQNDIDVFISYGNHDFIEGNTYPITYPDNVYIFPNEKVTAIPYIKNGYPIANIYGFSYVKRDVRENKAEQFTIQNDSVPFHIGMLHGTLHGNQDHDPYAPFRLEDLQREPFDYWALGHIHKRAVIQENPPVVYPGNIQGRHRNESGAKGCYYVTLNHVEVGLQFIPLQHVTIVEKQIDLTSYKTIPEMRGAIVAQLNDVKVNVCLVHLTCVTNDEQIETLGLTDRIQELIDMINEQSLQGSAWSYIYRYRITSIDENKQRVDSFFMKEITEAAKLIDITDAIDDLYSHTQAKKQLNMPNEAEFKKRAIQYVTEEMSKKVR